MRLVAMEETDLIKACQNDDSQAFRQLYDRYGRMLYGIALRYAGDDQEAQDILQESLIKIFKSIKSYQFKGSFEGWMKRLLVNTAINHFKKAHRIHEMRATDDMPLVESKEFSAIDRLSAQELIDMINELPEGYRLVFNLYVMEGYDHREISKELGISEGTSRSQLTKARRKLQEIIQYKGYAIHESA